MYFYVFFTLEYVSASIVEKIHFEIRLITQTAHGMRVNKTERAAT